MLPKNYKARKSLPMYTFLTKYFPDAIIELVKVSVAGNVQHNPGQPMHWARGTSTDQMETAVRHIFDHGMGNTYDDEPPEVLATIGDQGTMHLAKAAWRLLAEIQLICEARQKALSSPLKETDHAGGEQGATRGDVRSEGGPLHVGHTAICGCGLYRGHPGECEAARSGAKEAH